MIVDFLGYAAAFWLTWKCLDGLSVLVFGRKDNSCKKCEDSEDSYVYGINPEDDEIREGVCFPSNSDKEQELSDLKFLLAVNTATEEQLDEISGVGPVTARKIIKRRPYYSVEDCEQVISRTLITAARRWAKEQKITLGNK